MRKEDSAGQKNEMSKGIKVLVSLHIPGFLCPFPQSHFHSSALSPPKTGNLGQSSHLIKYAINGEIPSLHTA